MKKMETKTKIKPKVKKIDFITKKTLKIRGWTDSLIKIFLPEPHKTKKNPIFSSASPMCLYELKKVERIEKTKKFLDKFEKAKKRKEGAKEGSKKAVATKLKNLIEKVNQLEFEIPKISKEKLLRRSISHYNKMQDYREMEGYNKFGKHVNGDSDKLFLDRIQVNYLRHCMTSYEEDLDGIRGNVGSCDGYFMIRKKIFDNISNVYPWLKDECERQNGD